MSASLESLKRQVEEIQARQAAYKDTPFDKLMDSAWPHRSLYLLAFLGCVLSIVDDPIYFAFAPGFWLIAYNMSEDYHKAQRERREKEYKAQMDAFERRFYDIAYKRVIPRRTGGFLAELAGLGFVAWILRRVL
jgi:hypothetical protein